jgi:hypothetical protein
VTASARSAADRHEFLTRQNLEEKQKRDWGPEEITFFAQLKAK